MTPAFITPEYVAACTEAPHVQGWWTATWTENPAAGIIEQDFLGVDSRDTLVHGQGKVIPSAQPPWALPPVGTGTQTNVRMGDFLALVDGGVVVLDSHEVVMTLPWPLGVAGTIFLPRLDQLLWMLGPSANYNSAWGGVSLDERLARGWHMGSMGKLLSLAVPYADARLASLGCPAREVS